MVKQKTGIKLSLIVSMMFVGIGNMIMNHQDKVFLVVVVVAIKQEVYPLISLNTGS